MRKLLIPLLAAVVLVIPAAAANEFTLTVVSQTNSTITFSYPAQTGYGYLYSANGTVVSRTNDASKTQIKFAKANSYEVATITKGTTGTYPVVAPPTPAQCADGIDNDGDTKIDLNDPGCSSASDNNEADDPIPPPSTGFPNSTNTGVPAGTVLHTTGCPSTITVSGTYDKCQFASGVNVRANNVRITNSMINGYVNAGDGQQTGLVISDSEINCNCQANGSNGTPPAIGDSNYTLLRVNVHNSGHGASVKDNVVIQDSWIHGLGGTNDAHKDGIYSGDGSNVQLLHNNIECDAGDGCTSAIGILTDFSTIFNWKIDGNLLNTSSGSYCLYGSGGPQKPFGSHDITVTNNTFGQKYHSGCGFYGPVTYYDTTKPGMVWSNNKLENGTTVNPVY